MTTMIAEVYDALIEAGASQEKARQAAEAIVASENVERELGSLRQELKQELGSLRQEFKQETGSLRREFQQEISALRRETATKADVARLEGKFALLYWMLGFLLALVVALLFLQLRHG